MSCLPFFKAANFPSCLRLMPSMLAINVVVPGSVFRTSAGVSPSSSRAVMSAPLSISSLAASACPRNAAPWSGVPPSSLLALTSAPFSISRRIASVCPCKVAHAIGDNPSSSSCAFTSVPAARAASIASSFPATAAPHSVSSGILALTGNLNSPSSLIVKGCSGRFLHIGMPLRISCTISARRCRMNSRVSSSAS